MHFEGPTVDMFYLQIHLLHNYHLDETERTEKEVIGTNKKHVFSEFLTEVSDTYYFLFSLENTNINGD